MNKIQRSRWLAIALCAALAACSSMDNPPNNGYTSPGSSTGSSSTTSSTGSTGIGSSPVASGGASNAATGSNSSSSSSQVAYGTVLAIDNMQRQDIGAGTLGAAAAGGSMGAPTDRVYRIAVRMDDGTTQTLVVDSKPNYQNGDRVRYVNGVLEKY